MSFYNQPWFTFAAIGTAGVIGGVAIKFAWDYSAKRFDLMGKSYTALERAFLKATEKSPDFTGLDGEYDKVRNKCKKNKDVIELLDALDYIRKFGRFIKLKDGLQQKIEEGSGDNKTSRYDGLTTEQSIKYEQAVQTAQRILKAKCPK